MPGSTPKNASSSAGWRPASSARSSGARSGASTTARTRGRAAAAARIGSRVKRRAAGAGENGDEREQERRRAHDPCHAPRCYWKVARDTNQRPSRHKSLTRGRVDDDASSRPASDRVPGAPPAAPQCATSSDDAPSRRDSRRTVKRHVHARQAVESAPAGSRCDRDRALDRQRRALQRRVRERARGPRHRPTRPGVHARRRLPSVVRRRRGILRGRTAGKNVEGRVRSRGVTPLLGALALESLGVMLNPVTRELLPMHLILAAAAARPSARSPRRVSPTVA